MPEPTPTNPTAPPAEQQIAELLHHVGTGDLEAVRAALAARPELANTAGPHPFWGGRPQPLHVSIECNRREVFDLLLEAGADWTALDDEYHAEPAGWAETAVEVTNNPRCAEVAAYLRALEE